MKRTITHQGGGETTMAALRAANRPAHIVIRSGTTTLFTMYRPPLSKGVTPPAYHWRYKCVPERFTHRINGRYWCNPAHCGRSWVSKAKRDAHLDAAYGIL